MRSTTKLCPKISLSQGSSHGLEDLGEDFFDIPIEISSPVKAVPEDKSPKIWKRPSKKKTNELF